MDVDIFSDDGNGKYIKVFFRVDKGKIISTKLGNQVVPVEKGIQLYVKPYVAFQIDKCSFHMEGLEPKLTVREGEKIIEPTEEGAKRDKIKELERELKRLRDEGKNSDRDAE